MFQWNPASSTLYEPADIRLGQIVADFGCGPGHTAIEIAKWVGPGGHVHALDINSDFASQSRKNANAAGVGDRVTAHQCDGSILPLSDESLDRLTTRNTLLYVDDPECTIREFRRVLRAGGKVHAIEGDWPIDGHRACPLRRLGRACKRGKLCMSDARYWPEALRLNETSWFLRDSC